MLDLYNPDTLTNLCHTYNLRPSKKYGQNYLLDEDVIKRAVETADIKPTDTVVEVGPGFGVLTQALAAKAKRVVAFEIEQLLRPYWEKKTKSLSNVEIIWGNVLHQHAAMNSLAPYKVVANIPYQITAPLLTLFLEEVTVPEKMVLMVQKEVAERLTAPVGELSIIAVAVQLLARVRLISVVSKSSFWPSPAVDSALIELVPRPYPHSVPLPQVMRTVKAGFAARRKVLRHNLLQLYKDADVGRIEDFLITRGLTPLARAQELAPPDWVELTSILTDPSK